MRQSAGILLYKMANNALQVLLVHPGGPFWKNKDLGAWSIPKGEFTDNENPLDAAIREFEEETLFKIDGSFVPLKSVKLKSGKVIFGWALEHDLNASAISSNKIEIEWPPKSGKKMLIPEVDRAGWFLVEEAVEKINPAQAAFVYELVEWISAKKI